MPEMRFHVRWPDDTETACYSPSLIVRDYLSPGESYTLGDFVQRTREALAIAAERVRAKYGFACSRALDQQDEIERLAARYADVSDARVAVTRFDD